MLTARSSLTLSHRPSLFCPSFLAGHLGRSSWLHCPYRAGVCTYQSPRAIRMRPKVSFLSRVSQVWIESFPSPRPVARARLQSLVWPTILPIADICKSLLVGQQWHIHVSLSTREQRLWVLPYFSSSAPNVLFVVLKWILRWEVSGHTAAVLWEVASRIYSKQYVAFLRSFCLAFSPSVSLASRRCIYTVVVTRSLLERNPVLFHQISIWSMSC